ncbi:uncharacterized protein LOC129639493 [Bubalus kerabau]|uniref:uncharacterized protein LOC129639493 n=1 Tax=Bubalus carabanensis TaxID=3119969 RepID=UPI00244EE3F9|nr:uncharacterized protein LOC129639493 [Bubalus carabanensis]
MSRQDDYLEHRGSLFTFLPGLLRPKREGALHLHRGEGVVRPHPTERSPAASVNRATQRGFPRIHCVSGLSSLQSGTGWLEGAIFSPTRLRSSRQKEAGVSFQPPNCAVLSTPSHLRSILLPARSPTQCLEATSQRDENTTLHLFPLDYTSSSNVQRPSFGVFRVSMRESSSQTPCREQSTARKDTNGATGAARDADKPQDETRASTQGLQ